MQEFLLYSQNGENKMIDKKVKNIIFDLFKNTHSSLFYIKFYKIVSIFGSIFFCLIQFLLIIQRYRPEFLSCNVHSALWLIGLLIGLITLLFYFLYSQIKDGSIKIRIVSNYLLLKIYELNSNEAVSRIMSSMCLSNAQWTAFENNLSNSLNNKQLYQAKDEFDNWLRDHRLTLELVIENLNASAD